jgi:GNAT superfamily N-acetyltransferase
MRAKPFGSTRPVLRVRRWWAARSLPLRQIDVRARDRADAVILEAFVGDLRLGRLIATQATQLPAEAWVDMLPKQHELPTYWVSECLVDARFHNRGIGRRLVTKLVETAFARHSDALIVGWANSTQARRFAAELGFNVRDEAAYATLGSVAVRLLA